MSQEMHARAIMLNITDTCNYVDLNRNSLCHIISYLCSTYNFTSPFSPIRGIRFLCLFCIYLLGHQVWHQSIQDCFLEWEKSLLHDKSSSIILWRLGLLLHQGLFTLYVALPATYRSRLLIANSCYYPQVVRF